MQAFPPRPQLLADWPEGSTQKLPKQQPAQLVALQVDTALHLPKKQPWPAGHAAQVWPAMPQICADWLAVPKQMPFRQQPSAQVLAEQPVLVQAPF